MISRNGHACSPNAVVALDNTWDSGASMPIPLTRVATDSLSSAILAACQFDSLELDIDTVVGATTIQAVLTHDATGLHIIAGPSGSATLWAGAGAPQNGTSLWLNGRGFSTLEATKASFSPPAPVLGTVYLWLKLDAGTANLKALGARLNWRDPTSG